MRKDVKIKEKTVSYLKELTLDGKSIKAKKVKSNIIEFKFKNISFSHDTKSVNKHWKEVFDSYFNTVYGIKGCEMVAQKLEEGTDYSSEIQMRSVMPHTNNSFFTLNFGKIRVASFYMYGQNNCCGAMSVSNTYIKDTFRNRKLATLLQYYKEALAYSYQISRLYCTDILYDKLYETSVNLELLTPYTANSKVLLNTGWKIIDRFLNVKSNNVVAMYSKEVRKLNNEIIMNIDKSSETIVKIKNLTVGCDPELFLRDKTTKEYVPSYFLIKGDKENPQMITDEGHNIQCDNVMVEYGVPPSKTSEEFIKNNIIVQNYLKDKIAEPNGLELVIFPYAEFTENNVQDEKAKRFGCDPDFNVWKDGRPNIVGRPNPLGRSAGGHIHIGYDNFNTLTSNAIIKALDLFISVPLILMEPDNKRKEMYGKAGAYRPQPWGVEYRVTSNYIFSSPELMKWAFEQVTEAVNFVNAGKSPKANSTYPGVDYAINTKCKTAAKSLMKEFNIKLPAFAKEVAIS